MTEDEGVKDRVETSKRRAQKKAAAATEAAKRELSLDDIGVSPAVVGMVRGILYAAVMGALGYITTQLSSTAEGAGLVGGVAAVGVAVVRAVEGIIDVKLGAPRQARLLGGAPVRK